VLGSITLAAVVAAVPQFPDTWQSGTVSGIAIFQGGVKKPDGSVCCAGDAPGCKVQTVTLAGTTYNDGQNNRTRTDNAQGIIVNDYIKKVQMAVTPNPAGKGYVCQQKCPLQDEYSNDLKIQSNAVDKGTVMINGVETHEWLGYETILKVVRMEEQDAYIDQSDASNPQPVSIIEKLTPFDIPIIHPTKELGESATNYTNFTHGSLDPETFDVKNISDCPPPQNGCNQQSSDFESAVHHRAGIQEPQTVLDKIQDSLSEQKTEPRLVTETAGGKWPLDWSATEHSKMLINQGGAPEADGSYCCLPESSVQCQIQLQNGGGQRYMDYSNNRTRLEDIDGTIQIDDFKSHKSMEIQRNETTGKEQCVKYCPIDPEETLDGGAAFFLDDDATDMGATTYDGQPAEHWQWKEKILKIITMSTTDFFAGTDSSGFYTPLGQTQDLAPLGRHLGTTNMTWASFTPGKQPSDKFDIENEQDCPQDPQCGQNKKQLRRLALRQWKTFARYQKHF